MTTEDDFHALLDANPEYWQTRLILAERGDARAEGYRALGVLRRIPRCFDDSIFSFSNSRYMGKEYPNQHCTLPDDWIGVFKGGRMAWSAGSFGKDWWRDYESRREVEDAAALAFASLPPSRKAQLLTTSHAAAH